MKGYDIYNNIKNAKQDLIDKEEVIKNENKIYQQILQLEINIRNLEKDIPRLQEILKENKDLLEHFGNTEVDEPFKIVKKYTIVQY